MKFATLIILAGLIVVAPRASAQKEEDSEEYSGKRWGRAGLGGEGISWCCGSDA